MNNQQRVDLLKAHRIDTSVTANPWSEFFALTTRAGSEFDSEITPDMLGPFIAFMQRVCPVIGSRVLKPHHLFKDTAIETFGLYVRGDEDTTTLISYIISVREDGQTDITVHMLEDEEISASVNNYFR